MRPRPRCSSRLLTPLFGSSPHDFAAAARAKCERGRGASPKTPRPAIMMPRERLIPLSRGIAPQYVLRKAPSPQFASSVRDREAHVVHPPQSPPLLDNCLHGRRPERDKPEVRGAPGAPPPVILLAHRARGVPGQ